MSFHDRAAFSTISIPYNSNPSRTYEVVFCTKGAANPSSAATDKIVRTIIQHLPAPLGSRINHKTQMPQVDRDGFVIQNPPHTMRSYFDEMRAAAPMTDKEIQQPLAFSGKKANPTEFKYRLPVQPEIPFTKLWCD